MAKDTNLSDMTINGWNSKYSEIVRQFGYNKREDLKSARVLDSILRNPIPINTLKDKIQGKTVFVIGAGYSLSDSFKVLKKYNKIIKIAADTAVKPLLQNKIKPDIVITDIDGDEESLKKLGNTKTIFVIHAHGDNISKIDFAKNFKNCMGTTQTKPVGKIRNFGGFTDGDRGVFLASHFQAEKIILFGMDFGKRISRFSNTKPSERKTKIKKLEKAKELLEWLSGKTRSELYTTSSKINGFKKISKDKLDIIIT